MSRAEAVIALLRLPDARDLVGVNGRPRGYRYTQARDPKRSADELKRDLGTAYVERRRHDFGRDISAVVSFRRGNLIRMRRGA